MATKRKTVAAAQNNAPVDFAAEMTALAGFLVQAADAGHAREQAEGNAAFRLAFVLSRDALPSDDRFKIMRTHRPGSFFSSPDVRKVWNLPEARALFINASDAPEKINQAWRRCVEVAFTIWAAAEYFAAKSGGPQVNYEAGTIPVAAWCEGNDGWAHVLGDAKNSVTSFGTRTVHLSSVNPTKKGKAAHVPLSFIPSERAFLAERARWLPSPEVRSKRSRAESKGAAGNGVNIQDAIKAVEGAFTGTPETPSPLLNSADMREKAGDVLTVALLAMAEKTPDYLSGLLVDALHDEAHGAQLRAIMSRVLNAEAREAAQKVA